MIKPRLRRLLLLTMLVLALVATIPGQAQVDNLLDNGGFEDGFRNISGTAPRQVANSWQPWNVPSSDDSTGFLEPPLYLAASNAQSQEAIPRVRTGDDAQLYYSYFATHDGGIYQEISGLTPGTELRFSIYAYVFSSRLNDLNNSELPGGVALRVGIDPNGGTDPFSDDVVYSDSFIAYDAFRQYSIITEAQSSDVTVFVRSTVSEPVQFTYIYLDDAVLEITPDSQQPPEEDPTATNTPTQTPTATETDPPTATATPTPTNTPTSTPTTDDSDNVGDPTPTRETDDSNTDDPTPTRETDDENLPTATSIGSTNPTNTPLPTPLDPDDEDTLAEFPGRINYTVQRGDTVGRLAQRFDSSVDAIIIVNGLDPATALIFREQNLIIPVRSTTATATPTTIINPTATPSSGSGGIIGDNAIYLVQPGDTLASIARRFNTTVVTLVQLNGIINPNQIFTGQSLVLPVNGTGGPIISTPAPIATPIPPPPTLTTYTVQPGDTLYRLSLRFGIGVVAIAEANGISNYNSIFVGQALVIPQ